MRFSIRNLRAEKVCHSLYFPQNLDLTKLLETKGEPCSAEEQVRALMLLTHKHARTHTHTHPTHIPWPHQSPCLLSVSLPTPIRHHVLCLSPSPELPSITLTRDAFWVWGAILSSVAELRTHREEHSPTLSVIRGNILTHSRNTDLSIRSLESSRITAMGLFASHSHQRWCWQLHFC